MAKSSVATGRAGPKGNGQKRNVRPANRREMILDAAGPLFAERGYAAVSVDEIGGAVGITGPAIYSHFRSKDDLLNALLEHALDAIDDALESAVASATSPRTALDDFLRGTIRLVINQPYLASLYANEHHHLSEPDRSRLERKRRAIFRTEVELLRQLLPELPTERLQLRLFAVVSAMLGAIGGYPAKMADDDIVDELHRMAIAALLVA